MSFFPVHFQEKSKPSDAYDPAFGIKINEPRVSLEVFNAYCQDLLKTPLKSLKPADEVANAVTMGVIVQNSGCLKSAKKTDYVVWQLNDLMNETTVKILLFGDAATSHWKLQAGYVVALTHLQHAENQASTSIHSKQKTALIAFKVIKAIQVVGLGFCPDFGICQGTKKDGERCTNYVNVSRTPTCDYHLQQAAQKFRANRGAFSAISNERPKCAMAKPPKAATNASAETGPIYMVKREQQCMSKLTMRPGDRALIAARARLGQKALTALAENKIKEEQKEVETQKVKPESSSMKSFLAFKSKEERIRQAAIKAGSPNLNRSVNRGVVDLTSPQKPVSFPRNLSTKDLEARAKAVELFKKSKSQPQKRKLADQSGTPESKKALLGDATKTRYTDDRIRQLLSRRSTHESELHAADADRENRYFNQKEVEEKVESRMTTLTEMKDVSVVSCKVCDYTAPSAADLCKHLGHELVYHKASKRWFKCKECQVRTAVYKMMPTQPCVNCGSKNFERVAMKDERKVEIREKLMIRGEERTFVNT